MIASVVATAVVSYAINKGLDFIIDDKEKDFESQLRKCIDTTIAQVNKQSNKPKTGPIAFYEHDKFLETLITDGFLVQQTQEQSYGLTANLLKDEEVIPFTKQDIENFIQTLANNFKKYPLLQVLYIDTKFSRYLTSIDLKIDEVLTDTKEIKDILKKGAVKGEIPQDLTGPIPSRQASDLIGRTKDLKELKERLTEEQQALLMNGMGGVGKTTLAMAYATEYKQEYKHIAWLTLEDGLDEVLATHPVLGANLQLDLNGVPADQVTANILNNLNTLPGPNLLVLDNARQRLAQSVSKLPTPPNWQVLVTSREKIEGFTELPVDFLNKDDAVLLFKKFNTRFEDATITTIVASVEYHTLTIEILAKASFKNRWTAEQTLQALPTNAKAHVNVPHAQNQAEALQRVRSYISRILLATELTDEEIYILQYFTALPAQPIEYEILEILLLKDTLDWKDDFAATLEGLYEKGFLQKDIVADTYKIHAVLKEAVLTHHKPGLQGLLPLVKLMTKLLYVDQAKDNPVDKFPWVIYGEALKESLKEEVNPEITEFWNHLALVYQDLGRYTESADLLEKALAADLKHFEEGHPTVATRQSNLAVVYRYLSRYEEAAELLEKALEADTQHFGEGHPTVAVRQSNLASVYQDLGRYEEASVLLDKALEADIQHFGEGHPTVAISQSNLALVYKDLGRYEEASVLLEKALEANIQHFGEAHPTVAVRQSNLATVYRNLGRNEEAAELLEKALEADIQHFGEGHPTVATRQSNLALVYRDLGRYNEAADLLEKALEAELKHFGNKHPAIGISNLNLASVYYRQNFLKKALEHAQKALDIFIQALPEGHPYIERATSWVADIQKAMGE